MSRPPELVRQHQFAGSGCVSTLGEIAFVIALTAQQDEVLPTWKIKMILGRLSVSQQTGAVQVRHAVAPGIDLVYDSSTDPAPVVAGCNRDCDEQAQPFADLLMPGTSFYELAQA